MAVEKILIAGLIALPLVLLALFFSDQIVTAFNEIADLVFGAGDTLEERVNERQGG